VAIPKLEILRYPNLGPSLWSFDKIPADTNIENIPLVAQDRGESSGVLYSRGGEKTVFCMMHPRGDMTRHYAIPYLLEAGFAAFGQAGRWVNNDISLIHEMLLCDVAAGIRALKDRGFENVVLLGNSGGGALYTFYQAQASTTPENRLKQTAAGDPYDLGAFDLPEADGIVQMATHLGQGTLMLGIIDPSVVDETDPLSCDPSLDMYNPANGFAEPYESSSYDPEFLQRYREAQRGRVARLDAVARDMVANQRRFQAEMVAPDFEKQSLSDRNYILRRAMVGRYMTVNRTEAHPAYTDQSMHASPRDYGSFFTPRPDVFNYLEAGFGKYQTPRAWLSTWSGLSSRACTLDCMPDVKIPTIVISYTGDNVVWIPDLEAIHEASGASDKQLHFVDGDHLGLPPKANPTAKGRPEAMRLIVEWASSRW
jgi:hypothetical protein